jgi:uncharacterized protein with von Willebrand factor type A (vWA) domain
VKDEGLLDRFDQVFNKVFKGLLTDYGQRPVDIPEDWLKAVAEKFLSPEEMEKIKSLDRGRRSWKRSRSGWRSRKSATRAATSGSAPAVPAPSAIRATIPKACASAAIKHKRALKVWEKREFQNLDNTKELGTRNIKVALRRLRRFAREGNADELDLEGTIEGTAKQGWLDIRMRPEKRNAVKLLLFLDVGGSMDPFIKLVEELFSAATAEFKNMEFFYFHNCLYEGVWKDNKRRWSERTQTWDILHKYGHDYKVIFVGDAAMSPYEISHPGGSVEHFNEEAGAVWMHRMAQTYPATVWLNPVPEKQWNYSQSTKMLRDLVGGSMYPLTLEGWTTPCAN